MRAAIARRAEAATGAGPFAHALIIEYAEGAGIGWHRDRPVFGEVAGNIEHIGLKTTRIRALSGEQVVIANADLLRQSGLKAGDRALEYGAGFGQIALAFARTGVQVDTVDINPAFSAAVAKLGEHYRAPLTAHVGAFGDNPAGEDGAYDLIYFYESFHHCFDFFEVIPQAEVMGVIQDLRRVSDCTHTQPTPPTPPTTTLDA